MKKLLLAAMLSCAFSAQATTNENCVPLVSSYAMMVDVSGSMMQTMPSEQEDTKTKKIALAKALLARLAQDQDSRMKPALYTVAPFTVQKLDEKREDKALTEAIDNLPENLETIGRTTWLGKRGADHLLTVKEATTLVLITDGAFTQWRSEGKPDPKTVFQTFKDSKTSNRLFVISLASTDEEKAGINHVFNKADIYDLKELLSNQEKYEGLRNKIFALKCDPITLELRGVRFDFDKSTLTEESVRILKEALNFIHSRPLDEKIRVTGWTDWTGSDAYNLKLSERRAKAVRAFFIKEGIDKERLSIEGRGKSWKYDNRTKEGRHSNRRAELRFEAEE